MSSTGSTQTAYRGHRSRLEAAVKKRLIEKVTQEHGDETSRKTNLDTYLEDAARLLDLYQGPIEDWLQYPPQQELSNQ